jgi:hypothetical protein
VACGEESAAFGDAIARSERPDIDKTDGARITLHPGAVELAERNNMTRHLPDRFDCMVSADQPLLTKEAVNPRLSAIDSVGPSVDRIVRKQAQNRVDILRVDPPVLIRDPLHPAHDRAASIRRRAMASATAAVVAPVASASAMTSRTVSPSDARCRPSAA